MADNELLVRVIGDEKDYLRALRSSQGATQKFSASFGTFLKGALVFEGVRAGVDALGSAVRAGIDEFTQAAKVAAQTNAAIRSTGGVANVTAKDVERLSSSIQRLSGIDDELIGQGANLLLTFKNVRNEVGKGNAIFDRATKAAVDLSVAGFGAIPTTAKQLGKALNDPVRGLTALSRAGVTFTQQQKDQVKALVESGRALDAQRIILKEVESQVGGSAKAFGETLPGQLSKLREAFRNAFGSLVGAVAEPLAKAAGAFANFVPQIEQGIARVADAVGPGIGKFVEAFTSRLPELQRIASSILDPFRERVLPILSEFATVARDVFDSVVAVFSNRSGELRQILDNLGQVLANVWTIARPTIVFLFEKVLPAALNIAIPLLEKLTGVTKLLSDVFVKTVSTIIKALDVFLGGLTRVADAASHLPFIGDHFKGISDKVNASRESLQEFIKTLDKIDGRDVTVKVHVRPVDELGRGGASPETGAKDQADKANENARKTDASVRTLQTTTEKTTDTTKKAQTAAEKQRAAFDKLMDTLGLGRDRAQTTRGLGDDIKAVEAQRDALLKQLQIQKGNVDLQRQLLQKNQELTQLRKEQRQSRQFEALGLTAEGQERVPSAGALLKRVGSIENQIKGTALDTNKTAAILRRITNVLKGKFGAVGRDLRQAILGMLNDISSAFDQGGSDSSAPITKFRVANFSNIASQFPSLSQEDAKKLQQILSRRGASGTIASGSSTGGAFGFGPQQLGESRTNLPPLDINLTVEIDGQPVAATVTNAQIRAARRRSNQRTGRHK